ncbi:zinc finger and BTB domain-containing protein 49-like [Dysidea avara]|uniref:zinc finger and BTB domain-containing protein 49-like n=1 Tax=Dysidea avara TaxID=196820 RepID=UPI00331958F8
MELPDDNSGDTYAHSLEGINFSNPEHIFDFSASPPPKKTLQLNGKQRRKLIAKPCILLSELEIMPPDEDGEVRVRERKFKCKLCGEKFYRSTHLTRHMLVHTGEKPYTCHICRRRFARCDYKQAHVYTHRRDKVHSCPICGEVYEDLTRYADHCGSHPDSEYLQLCKQEEALKVQRKIAANNIKSSTTDQPVIAAIAKESASSTASLKNIYSQPIDKEADISTIQNPIYSLNCELPTASSAPNVSMSTLLLAANKCGSLDNGHPMSPVYILVSPSEELSPAISYQSQPPPLLIAS